MVPDPMLGTVEPEVKVSASAPCPSKTNIRTSKWLDLFFPSKGILRRQNSLEPSLLTHLAFVKHKKSSWTDTSKICVYIQFFYC